MSGVYYATDTNLNVVDFDGTGVTPAATFVEPLLPGLTAMSEVVSDRAPPQAIPRPGGAWLMIGALGLLGVAGRRRTGRAPG